MRHSGLRLLEAMLRAMPALAWLALLAIWIAGAVFVEFCGPGAEAPTVVH